LRRARSRERRRARHRSPAALAVGNAHREPLARVAALPPRSRPAAIHIPPRSRVVSRGWATVRGPPDRRAGRRQALRSDHGQPRGSAEARL
jgi:hypothetical protein